MNPTNAPHSMKTNLYFWLSVGLSLLTIGLLFVPAAAGFHFSTGWLLLVIALLGALAAIGLTGRFLGTAVGIFSTGAVLSGVGAFAAGFLGMKWILKLVSHLTTPKSKQGVPEEGIPNDVSPEELQEFSEKAFTLLETKVLACLGLEKMDLTEFRRKIKESEVS